MYKVIFTGDYTGNHGAGRKGEIRTISDKAFWHLKTKGLVNIFREKKETKELKLDIETKDASRNAILNVFKNTVKRRVK